MNPNKHNPFTGLKVEEQPAIMLSGDDRFDAAGHWWSQPEIDALTLAHAARRPLLVRGEAGSGKSQIARAAAAHLGAPLLVEVIHPRFEALDLLYQPDAVERLADAQIHALDRSNKKYVKKGRLWEAFEPHATGKTPVLLIDEIDKADADVPNALLEVMGNRSFSVPYLENLSVRAADGRLPLIIITINEERELPSAFVRRCVVLNLNPPKTDRDFIEWLVTRAKVHKHLQIAEAVYEQAAQQVLEDRNVAIAAGYPRVGLAEYIDLLSALHELTLGIEDEEQRHAEQIDWLARLSAYALVKNADQAQDRKAVATKKVD